MIRVENLSLRLGSFALDSISFEVAAGQYAVLMGRTGTGKTTLMEALCGLRRLSSGRIWVGGSEVTRRKPAERGIGFVPQEAALFESMSVRDQLGFALTVRKWKSRDIDRRVHELAELLGIKPLLARKPAGLSGGERQRVALGRALAPHPDTLCLDEPLSALDDVTRDEMYGLLSSIRGLTHVTTLHITHSRREAARLADVVLVLENGTIRPATVAQLEDEAASPLREPSRPRRHAGT